ncbi:MAG: general secretion pathway protein GspK [Proteobacteria bacterium]|nr:general secretion pathway protein GspK [Pseudomonadota bacterium]
MHGRLRKTARVCAGFWQRLNGDLVPMGGVKRRGIALLLVLTYIAVMTATVLSGFTNSQVSYSISANVRDDLKAYYKAKSALNLGRLMLTYQYELEKDEFFGTRLRKSNFQLYQIMDILMTPFKTGIVSVDVPNADMTIASYNLHDAGVDAMGEASGDFTVKVSPEEGRVNLNKFSSSVSDADLYELCMLLASPKYDELFNSRSSKGFRLTRMDQIAAIIDWVDADGEKTYITNECKKEESNGDETSLYVDQRKKYNVKNAKLTTLDELYEVAGFGDDMMEAFREMFTVYPVNKVNVNLASAKVLYSVLCNAVEVDDAQKDNRIWACSDATIGTQLLALAMALEGYQQFVSNPMNLLYLYIVMGETSVIPNVVPNGTVVPFRRESEFYKVVKAMVEDSTQVPKFLMYSPTAYLMFQGDETAMLQTSVGLSNLTFNTTRLYSNITTETPRVFRVVAVGEYGGTRRTLTTVIDFNTTGGKYLYWREN